MIYLGPHALNEILNLSIEFTITSQAYFWDGEVNTALLQTLKRCFCFFFLNQKTFDTHNEPKLKYIF